MNVGRTLAGHVNSTHNNENSWMFNVNFFLFVLLRSGFCVCHQIKHAYSIRTRLNSTRPDRFIYIYLHRSSNWALARFTIITDENSIESAFDFEIIRSARSHGCFVVRCCLANIQIQVENIFSTSLFLFYLISVPFRSVRIDEFMSLTKFKAKNLKVEYTLIHTHIFSGIQFPQWRTHSRKPRREMKNNLWNYKNKNEMCIHYSGDEEASERGSERIIEWKYAFIHRQNAIFSAHTHTLAHKL